jgi:DNA-binding HxlR family transcriptional regulator
MSKERAQPDKRAIRCERKADDVCNSTGNVPAVPRSMTEHQKHAQTLLTSVGTQSEWSSSARFNLAVDHALPLSCERVTNILEGRGKVHVILHLLIAGTQRFSEIERAIHGICQRRLVRCLRELEADGIVHRVVHHQIPPRVDYSPTVWGHDFSAVLRALCVWSESCPSTDRG